MPTNDLIRRLLRILTGTIQLLRTFVIQIRRASRILCYVLLLGVCSVSLLCNIVLVKLFVFGLEAICQVKHSKEISCEITSTVFGCPFNFMKTKLRSKNYYPLISRWIVTTHLSANLERILCSRISLLSLRSLVRHRQCSNQRSNKQPLKQNLHESFNVFNKMSGIFSDI